MTYNCILCNKEFKSSKEKNPLLQICNDCKKEHPDIVKNNISKVLSDTAEKQKKYWKEHPEEYREFLKERNKKKEETLIKKYGSLEEAEKNRMQKQLETLKKKYPDEDWNNITNPSQLKVAKENIKRKSAEKDSQFWKERKKKADNTKIEKYGSLEKAYASMNEKVKATIKEKYSEEDLKVIQEKKKQTLNKLLEENPEYWKDRAEKTKQTKIEKYGSLENAYSIMTENFKKSMLQKYGVNYIMDVPEFKEKMINSKQKNIKDNPDYWKNIREKTKQTKIEKYGSLENAKDSRMQKFRETCLEKYEVETPFESESIKQKIKDSLKEKYDISNVSQLPTHKEKVKNTISQFLEKFEKENNCTRYSTLIEKYGQGWLSLDLPYLKNKSYVFVSNDYIPQIEEYYRIGNSPTSHSEKDILTFIKNVYSGEILENVRNIINPYELDIYIPEKKIAIEYNGDFWHSTNNKEKRYHEIKSKLCEEKGIRLIHIYECEWKYSREKLESLIRIALGCGYSKIGARKCEVRKISNKEAKEFNDKNHLQNHRNALVTYGLFYNNELQQLMSFSRSQYNKNLKGSNNWEIIRGCPGSNNQIIGGVSKLFKTFIKEYNPDSIFSYCDFNKFDGKGYEAIGMKFLGYTGPDKFYVDKSGHKVNRNTSKRKLLESTCPYTIFGAGSKKYIWEKNENA